MLAEVAQTVDRVVIVDHGRLRYEGPPTEDAFLSLTAEGV
jgi:ABC-type multidrug transport system ATPase subunit